MTTKQIQRLDASLYTTRKTSTVAGKVWSFTKFQRRFAKHFPILRTIDFNDYTSRLKVVNVYNDINKVLRKRGMAIKARKYYSEFELVLDTSDKVKSLDNKVSRITAYRNDLNLGIRTYGNAYTAKLTSDETESIANQSPFSIGHVGYGS